MTGSLDSSRATESSNARQNTKHDWKTQRLYGVFLRLRTTQHLAHLPKDTLWESVISRLCSIFRLSKLETYFARAFIVASSPSKRETSHIRADKRLQRMRPGLHTLQTKKTHGRGTHGVSGTPFYRKFVFPWTTMFPRLFLVLASLASTLSDRTGYIRVLLVLGRYLSTILLS